MTGTQQRTILVEEDGYKQTGNEIPIVVQSSPAFLDRWLDRAGKLPPIVAAIIALAYVAGYVIDGVYLNMLGIRPPDLIASRYLATGIVYLTMTLLPLAIVTVGFWVARRLPDTWGKWRRRLARGVQIVTIIVLVVADYFCLAGTLTGGDPNATVNGVASWQFWIALIASLINAALWLMIVMMVWTSTIPDNGPAMRWWSAWYGPAAFITLIPIVFVLTLGIFAGFVYPHIRTAYGGGASTHVQLIVDKGGTMSTILPMSDDTTTDTLALVDQNEDGYIVWLPDQQKIVAVPKDAVHGVITKPLVSSSIFPSP